jgi:hypothetical protein
MKTNQIMVRPMGDFKVTQRTKDGFFNATELLKRWNEKSGMKKELKHYFENQSSNELINTIVERENLNSRNSAYLSSRGKNGGTWMHPILFIDFAMWINPSFKYDVIKFVYDEMIRYRNEAGDAYRELSSAIMKIVPKDFMPKAMQKIGEALNWVVFNQHEKMLRNKFGDEKKQRELCQLEKKVADLINEGFITSFDNLISYLRNQYQKRNYPPVFLAS